MESMHKKSDRPWSEYVTKLKMTQINKMKLGKDNFFVKQDLSEPIQGYDSLVNALRSCQKNLTAVLENLKYGSANSYRTTEDLYRDVDRVWRSMEKHAGLKDRYLLYNIDILPQKTRNQYLY
jgi:hypothetical protein